MYACQIADDLLGCTLRVQVLAMLRGDKPLPWEGEGSAAAVAMLGALKEPVLQLLRRDAAQRTSAQHFHETCSRMFANRSTTRGGAADCPTSATAVMHARVPWGLTQGRAHFWPQACPLVCMACQNRTAHAPEDQPLSACSSCFIALLNLTTCKTLLETLLAESQHTACVHASALVFTPRCPWYGISHEADKHN